MIKIKCKSNTLLKILSIIYNVLHSTPSSSKVGATAVVLTDIILFFIFLPSKNSILKTSDTNIKILMTVTAVFLF